MATAKTTKTFISLELDWLEGKVAQLKMAIDNYDIANLEDRYGPKEMPNGKVVQGIIKDKESQMKDIVMVMEKLAKMLPSLDEMREKEAAKVETRGGVQMGSQAKEWLEKRK